MNCDLWMTRQERRALERAEEQGFLVCRSQQKFLIDEWSRRCLGDQKPSLRVETGGGKAQLIVNVSRGLTQEQQLRLRERLSEATVPEPTSLLPIVHRFGAYSQHMKLHHAHEAARELGHLLAGEAAPTLGPVEPDARTHPGSPWRGSLPGGGDLESWPSR